MPRQHSLESKQPRGTMKRTAATPAVENFDAEQVVSQSEAMAPQTMLQLQRTIGNQAVLGLLARRADGDSIQRAVEFRPPGKGEASAFERRQELVDRLNAQSTAIKYSLEGQTLKYEVVDEAKLTNFDRQMQKFIDQGATIPLRLITSSGLVGDRASGFQSLLVDSLQAGYLDLDDMIASDSMSFQMNMIHILTERSAVKNYDRRIGTDMSRDFPGAHQAGIDAETEHLRSVVGDPTIRFVFEEAQASGNLVFGFRSKEGYSIFHVFPQSQRNKSGGKVFVITRDKRRLTIDELIAERAAKTAENETSPSDEAVATTEGDDDMAAALA